MRVHLGSDHAGLELKEHLLNWLADQGYEVVDHGPFVYDAEDDYPVFCLRCAEGVAADSQDGQQALGVVIGGSGNGEQIAANKVKGVRSALAWSEETAELARLHNDANVVSVGGRMHTVEDMTRFVEVFLTTDYSEEPRHTRRIAMLADYEKTGNLPPLPDSAIGRGAGAEHRDGPTGDA
jgi:ribose 5-phosphate isomerase B